jgi:hypothetical protein
MRKPQSPRNQALSLGCFAFVVITILLLGLEEIMQLLGVFNQLRPYLPSFGFFAWIGLWWFLYRRMRHINR